MKKLLALLLAMVMVMCLFAACDKGDSGDDEEGKKSSQKGYEVIVDLALKRQIGTITKSEYKSAFPDEYWEQFNFDEEWEDYQSGLEDLKARLEEEFGENITTSFKITNAEKFSEEDLENLRSEAEEGGILDPDGIEDAYYLDFEYTIKGSESENTDTITTAGVICYKGQWYAMD